MELRTEAYLSKPVIDVLRKHGAGVILSHWTWLPALRMQFAKAGNRFITAGRQAVIRLMTPIGIRYEDAYAKAFPFDRLIEEMIQPGMIPQTARLMWEALRADVELNIIINNRAAGNAPLLARKNYRGICRNGEKKKGIGAVKQRRWKGAAITAIFNTPMQRHFYFCTLIVVTGMLNLVREKLLKLRRSGTQATKKTQLKKRRRPDYHDGKRCSASRSSIISGFRLPVSPMTFRFSRTTFLSVFLLTLLGRMLSVPDRFGLLSF